MSHDNPQIKPRKRRKRGTGGINRRMRSDGSVSWVAAWVDGGKKHTRTFRSRHEAVAFLAHVAPEWRDLWLAELRGLLWAELQARLRFKEATLVSTRKIA